MKYVVSARPIQRRADCRVAVNVHGFVKHHIRALAVTMNPDRGRMCGSINKRANLGIVGINRTHSVYIGGSALYIVHDPDSATGLRSGGNGGGEIGSVFTPNRLVRL